MFSRWKWSSNRRVFHIYVNLLELLNDINIQDIPRLCVLHIQLSQFSKGGTHFFWTEVKLFRGSHPFPSSFNFATVVSGCALQMAASSWPLGKTTRRLWSWTFSSCAMCLWTSSARAEGAARTHSTSWPVNPEHVSLAGSIGSIVLIFRGPKTVKED